MASNAQEEVNSTVYATQQSLDACIYEFLKKSSLNNTANAFIQESGLTTPIEFGSDVPQGFLYEWWQIFWDLFNARAHHEGSIIAKQYYQILAEQQKKEYAYRSVALQAARLQFLAEQSGGLPNELIDPAAFSINSNMPLGVRPGPDANLNWNINPGIGGFFPAPATCFLPQQNFVNNSGWPVYPNQIIPGIAGQTSFSSRNHYEETPMATPPASTKHKVSTGSTIPAATGATAKQPTLKRRASTNTTNLNGAANEFRSPKVLSSTHSTPYDAYSGAGNIGKTNNELITSYQRQFSAFSEDNAAKKSSPSPLSNGASVSANGSSNINNKKHMLPPYAGVSPHTVTTPNAPGGPNIAHQPKLKPSRRKSNSSGAVPTSKSMQNSLSDVVYSQYSPVTPITVNGGNELNASGNVKPVLPSSLATVTEGQSTNSSSGSPELVAAITSKKTSKKVRKTKKTQQVLNNNQNGNFKFVSSNSVPTPPNESYQKSHYRILNKSQTRKATNGSSIAKNNKVTSKSSNEDSPQLSLDETSSSTPTFMGPNWNASGKSQTTPHGNFTFIEDHPSSTGVTSSFPATENTMGSSSSGASNQFSENEADDLLTMKSILAIHDTNADKNAHNTAGEPNLSEHQQHHHESGSHAEFNLDLLEPSESSFNFLSWQG